MQRAPQMSGRGGWKNDRNGRKRAAGGGCLRCAERLEGARGGTYAVRGEWQGSGARLRGWGVVELGRRGSSAVGGCESSSMERKGGAAEFEWQLDIASAGARESSRCVGRTAANPPRPITAAWPQQAASPPSSAPSPPSPPSGSLATASRPAPPHGQHRLSSPPPRLSVSWRCSISLRSLEIMVPIRNPGCCVLGFQHHGEPILQ